MDVSLSQLRNMIQAEVAVAIQHLTQPRHARISAYNPDTPHLVKVQMLPQADYTLQDGDVAETNWIPIHHPMTGVGSGDYAGPSIGDQVQIGFQQGDPNSPVAVARINDDDHLPPSGIQSGERWIVLTSGVFLKMLQDGTFHSAAPNGYQFTGNAVWVGNFEVQGQFSASAGAAITGALTATEGITAGYGGPDPVGLQTHTHKDAGGSGNSGSPNAGT